MWKKIKYKQTTEENNKVFEEQKGYNDQLTKINQANRANIHTDLQANSLREWNRIREQFDDEQWAQVPD